MNSDIDLPLQSDTIQQPPLMKKKSNLLWIATAIPLLVANLQYLGFLYSLFDRPDYGSFDGTTHHLSALLVVDLVAASLYLQKKSNPNWKVIFILLFMFNLILFRRILSWIINLVLFGRMPSGINNQDVAFFLLEVILYFPILAVIDIIAVIIKKHPHSDRVWVISNITLIVVGLVLSFIGFFLFR